jgi:hypothetical protein
MVQAGFLAFTKHSAPGAFHRDHGKKLLLWLAVICLISIAATGNSQSTSLEEPSHVWKASWITSPRRTTQG